MENKELLEAIGQMIAQELEPIKTDFKELKGEVQTLRGEVESVKGITLRMEQDHGKKLTALFDGYTANYEIMERYDPRVTKLERAVEKLNFELAYLKVSQS
ncbi:MAG: hypothetical protein LBT32_04045 [Peptococcaceae bacterium]|jgi:polyhydroxyalkanoate synthesis regulator phasin|nr:hypothetical protein [Peptococcaceae bacterium]